MVDLLSRSEPGGLMMSVALVSERGAGAGPESWKAHPKASASDSGDLTISILDDIAPAIFYVALSATAGGAIVLARGAVEGSSAGRRRAGFALLGLGLAAILAAVVIYATGPRRVLPF
jgi:hypothetical protein